MPCNGEFEGSSLIHAFLFVVVISQFIGEKTVEHIITVCIVWVTLTDFMHLYIL